jgi:hypothetical protein
VFARPSTLQHHWQAHNDALQPCGARRHGKWRDRSKVHNKSAQVLGRQLHHWSSPLVSLDSGCTAMLFGPNSAIIRQHLGSHETGRRAANGGKAFRDLVLAADAWLFSETSSCQCIHPMDLPPTIPGHHLLVSETLVTHPARHPRLFCSHQRLERLCLGRNMLDRWTWMWVVCTTRCRARPQVMGSYRALLLNTLCRSLQVRCWVE